MSRNLLHKSKLVDLKLWLNAQGISWREGRGDWQLMQIRQPGRTQWDVIYERLEMKEHVTVVRPLEAMIHKFIQESKHEQQPRDTVRETAEEEIAPGPRHSSGESSLPWDA